jgi:hypothetical protein
MQLDWTNANELGITIAGQPYEHQLCHGVLPPTRLSEYDEVTCTVGSPGRRLREA